MEETVALRTRNEYRRVADAKSNTKAHPCADGDVEPNW